MPEIETITWRELTGNRYNQALHPAMLSEAGYVAQRAIRRIGDVEKTIFNVVYDREYLLKTVGKRICQTLFVLGKEETLKVVGEAWDFIYGINSDSTANQ